MGCDDSPEKKRKESESNGTVQQAEHNGLGTKESGNESKKNLLPRKVYCHRNSVLTDLMEVNHLQTVYNISVAVCILLLINATFYYLAIPEKFWQDTSVMRWGASKFLQFTKIWLLFHLYAYLVYEGFKLWVRFRNRINSKVADVFFLIIYISSIITMFSATPYAVIQNELPPITGFAIMMEQVRVFMKIYSFVRENVPRALQYQSSKDGNQAQKLYPSLKHYFYFLFIPALIYRDSYPKTNGICWNFVYFNLFKFLSCIFITYCVFMRFNVDIFHNTGLQQFTLAEAALTLAGSMVVGSMFMFLVFYSILHCWLNAFAEILQFGDREFYQDWWNSTSFSQYYRRWNTVVYDWLFTYLYVDSYKLGCKRSKALILVFIGSAIVHEYIICFALGFFYPVLLVVYSTVGIFVVFLTSKRTAQFWNTFMWSMLFSGWGLIITLYSAEWYARVNCEKIRGPILDFFIPRSWESSCKILTYS